MTTIFVRNNGQEPLQDRFDGVSYRFPPGEAVELPVEAARHIFGYGLEDKTANLVRLGWSDMALTGEKTVADALKRLAKFQFLTGHVVVDDETGDPEGSDAAAPRKAGRSRKTPDSTPPAA